MAQQQVKAGRAYVEIGLRSRIHQEAKNVERDLAQMGRKIGGLGAVLGGAGIAMASPFVLATKTFAGFDDAIRSVAAVSGAAGSDLEMLRTTAKELGRTTSFTAIQVASLMTELGRAGFNPSQINEMTGAVLALSRATGTEATLAAGIMAATIRQFGMEATDAARVADVLTTAANKSFNTVEQLGEALSYAGPVAADFGMSIEETAAVLGTLGNVGIQASSAGTTLRRLLTITGAEAQRLQEIFGVSFVDASGNARPLIDTLGEVAQATNGLGTAVRSQKFNDAFGLLGITGASAIGKVTTQTKDLYRELLNAAGAADETATAMDAGLGGSFRILMSAIEGVNLAIGETYEKELAKLNNAITTAAGSVTSFIEENKDLVVTVAATSAGLIVAGGTFVGVGLSLKTLSIAASGFSFVMGTVDVVVGLASSAVKGFGTAVTIAASIAKGIYTASIAAATVAVAGLTGVQSLGTIASTAFAVAGGLVAASWSAAAGAVASAWAAILAPLTPFIAIGAAAVATLAMLSAGAAVLSLKSLDLSKGFEIAKETLRELLGIAKFAGGVIMDALANGQYQIAAEATWQGIKLVVLEGLDGLSAGFGEFFDEAWNMAKTFFARFAELSVSVMTKVAAGIVNPALGALQLGKTLQDIQGMSLGVDFSIDTEDAKASAKNRLIELRKMMNGVLIQNQRREQQQKPPVPLPPGAPGVPGIPGAPMGDAEQRRKMDELKQQLESGEITPGEYQKRAAEIASGADKSADAFRREVEAIKERIIALRQGEEAAERFRLKNEGFTDQQIDALMRWKQAQDRAQADQDAREEKQRNAEQARRELFERGKRLAEELRTPQEKLKAELLDIAKLQNVGAIDAKTAERARAAARDRFGESLGKAEELASRTGPSGNFSAFAAGIIGMGGQSVQDRIAKNTDRTAKATEGVLAESKKAKPAKFGA